MSASFLCIFRISWNFPKFSLSPFHPTQTNTLHCLGKFTVGARKTFYHHSLTPLHLPTPLFFTFLPAFAILSKLPLIGGSCSQTVMTPAPYPMSESYETEQIVVPLIVKRQFEKPQCPPPVAFPTIKRQPAPTPDDKLLWMYHTKTRRSRTPTLKEETHSQRPLGSFEYTRTAPSHQVDEDTDSLCWRLWCVWFS